MIAIARLSERSFCAPDILWYGSITEKAGILNVNIVEKPRLDVLMWTDLCRSKSHSSKLNTGSRNDDQRQSV